MIASRVRQCSAPTRSICPILYTRAQLSGASQAPMSRAGKLAMTAMAEPQDYSQLSHEQLQKRIKMLEMRLGGLEKQLVKFEGPSNPSLVEKRLIV